MKKILFALCSLVFALYINGANAATDLTSMASVNVTSDTSAIAKKMAMDEAYRQIITDTVSKFIIDKDKFKTLLQSATESELSDLVSSVSIDNEKQSSTTYSANITITLNNSAVAGWLNENGVNNVLENSISKDKKAVILKVPTGLLDWIEFNNFIQKNNINFNVNKISNGQIGANILISENSDFISAVKNAGWKYSDNAGVITVWR